MMERKEVDGKSDNIDAEQKPSIESLIVAAGTTGKRNYLIYFFCVWASFIWPMHGVSYQFLGATPDYWCHVEELNNANWTEEQMKLFSMNVDSNSSVIAICEVYDFNYTLAAEIGFEDSMETEIFDKGSTRMKPCYKRTFDPTAPITVVSKWDLVCDRRALYSTTQAVVQAGILIGSLTMGYLLEIFGRKKPIVWNIFIYLIIGVVTAFSPNITIYLILKFLISAQSIVFFLGGIVLCLELCSAEQRSFLGPFSAVPWSIGYMLCPGIAYLIRPFPYLQIASTLPLLTAIPCIWIIPESPRWLVIKGRFEEAIQVLEKIAKFNNRILPSKEQMLKIMQSVYDEHISEKTTQRINLYKLIELWFFKEWRIKIFLLFLGWFCVSMVYYGVSLNPPNLSEGKYLYIFLGGLIEIPSYFILWPLIKYVGRTKSFVLLFWCSALVIFGSMGVLLSSEKDHVEDMPSYMQNWMMFLSLMGKFAISAAFQLVWMYTPELVATEYRSVITGEASMFARFGSISSPYIVDLIGEQNKWAPLAIFGTVSVVAGICMTFLPETNKTILQDSTKKNTTNLQMSKLQPSR